MNQIDIVIPLYNSTTILPQLIKRLNEWKSSIDYDFRVIFIDDASKILSDSILKEAKKSFDYKLIRLARNYGQHTATAVGLSYCTAPLIVTIDDDLQHDPFEINKLMNHMNKTNSDLVFGSFDKKEHSFLRNIGSTFLKFIFSFEEINYEKITSFRLMKLSVAKSFSKVNKPIVFIEEFLLRNSKIKTTCKINHYERMQGKSNYSYWSLIKLALKIILFHSSVPLKFIIRLGLLTALVCFIIGCYFIYKKVVYDSQMGFSSIIVSIFFSTGLILMSLGIIGEYIRRIWLDQQQLEQVIIEGDIYDS